MHSVSSSATPSFHVSPEIQADLTFAYKQISTFNKMGYLPLIGSVVGIARIVYGVAIALLGTITRQAEMRDRGKSHLYRGWREISPFQSGSKLKTEDLLKILSTEKPHSEALKYLNSPQSYNPPQPKNIPDSREESTTSVVPQPEVSSSRETSPRTKDSQEESTPSEDEERKTPVPSNPSSVVPQTEVSSPKPSPRKDSPIDSPPIISDLTQSFSIVNKSNSAPPSPKHRATSLEEEEKRKNSLSSSSSSQITDLSQEEKATQNQAGKVNKFSSKGRKKRDRRKRNKNKKFPTNRNPLTGQNISPRTSPQKQKSNLKKSNS